MADPVPSLPLGPLWNYARSVADLPDGPGNDEASTGFTVERFARMIGINKRSVYRWLNENRVPWDSADKAAINLGSHPALIWGEDWWNVKGDFEQLTEEALVEDSL